MAGFKALPSTDGYGKTWIMFK